MSACEDTRQPFVDPMTALQSCIFEGDDWANVARLAHQIETMALKRAKKALDEVDEMDGADK